MSGLKPGDWVALVVFGGFGLWWLLFPKSVIAFYEWFHRKPVSSTLWAIRIVGLVWFVLIVFLMFTGKLR